MNTKPTVVQTKGKMLSPTTPYFHMRHKTAAQIYNQDQTKKLDTSLLGSKQQKHQRVVSILKQPKAQNNQHKKAALSVTNYNSTASRPSATNHSKFVSICSSTPKNRSHDRTKMLSKSRSRSNKSRESVGGAGSHTRKSSFHQSKMSTNPNTVKKKARDEKAQKEGKLDHVPAAESFYKTTTTLNLGTIEQKLNKTSALRNSCSKSRSPPGHSSINPNHTFMFSRENMFDVIPSNQSPSKETDNTFQLRP